jgi:hypothetical protein
MVPAVALPPTTPPAFQVTSLLERPLTLAVNCCVALTPTIVEFGKMLIVCAEAMALSAIRAIKKTHPVFHFMSVLLLL